MGGKNASLGEMIRHLRQEGIRVPQGFATTAEAYWRFLKANDLESVIREQLEEQRSGRSSLAKAGKAIRSAMEKGRFPEELAKAIAGAYRQLAERAGRDEPPVAVRSSATAEDLPEASFAGQQESFLNIHGEKALLDACRRCYASLFTDRAIAYRENHGFDHMQVALSIGVQRMVRSDLAGAGVMFSIDTESGFRDAVLINAAFGLGESVVQGSVDPDEYLVFKPLLEQEGLEPIIEKAPGAKGRKIVFNEGREPTKTVKTRREEQRAFVLDNEAILQLARWAVIIERHYGRAMDMEWARDGEDGQLYIVQARPETVQSQKEGGALKAYRLNQRGPELVRGHAIGDAIASGKAIALSDPGQIERFEKGAVLVTEMTDPDWVPIMKKAAAIVTDHGGRTSHAAIVSREMGLPALVGCGEASKKIKDGQEVTVSCAEGEEGVVYQGLLDFTEETIELEEIPDTRTKVMLNLANPSASLRWWQLPADGVGLARMEFIINNLIKIHPLALIHYDRLKDREAKKRIDAITAPWGEDRIGFFVETLARGIGRIAASQYPRPVVVRMSDFKTNEYARLIGGEDFEPHEENPMLGWRGASRYYDPEYRPGFALECGAVKLARERLGLDNIIIMIPFCRTLDEADRVLETLAHHGLVRGEKGLQVYVMAEIPANVILAESFALRFDGFSIGSNDLTQLVLGVDRDSDRLSALFDERNEAVTEMIRTLIPRAHRHGCQVGLCGQAPSDHPDFAELLVEAGIDSISVQPDSFLKVKEIVQQAEKNGQRG
ncbi:MAG: phosphoenolpyruvate synthase [Candidatus Competibacteraceae bacterium]|nr:phosphoenolpyruvate synthase [Candidatus Competibacteraceae bacterium]